jgi:hypothetical protein
MTGRPLGRRYTSRADIVEYVRDPDGVFGRPELTVGLDLDAALPAEARDSGYRRDDARLWTVPGDESAVWLVDGELVERWPAGTPPLCR